MQASGAFKIHAFDGVHRVAIDGRKSWSLAELIHHAYTLSGCESIIGFSNTTGTKLDDGECSFRHRNLHNLASELTNLFAHAQSRE